MKLPKKELANRFINASGSNLPQEYAMYARQAPSSISEMAETPEEERMLKKEALARQYVLLIDRSGSMGSVDSGESHKTRWQSAEEACGHLLQTIFEYDIDHNIPVYLFGSKVDSIGEMQSPAHVKQLFREYQPSGTTNLAGALKEAMQEYVIKKRSNQGFVPGTTFIILTDGAPDNEEEVINYIKYVVDPKNKFVSNHEEVALSFVQIDDDRKASAFLQQLDDGFEPDIIDTKKDDILREPGGIDKLLFDAIFD